MCVSCACTSTSLQCYRRVVHIHAGSTIHVQGERLTWLPSVDCYKVVSPAVSVQMAGLTVMVIFSSIYKAALSVVLLAP